MSLFRCPNCSGVVSMRAPRCPHCLVPVEELLKTVNPLLPSDEADQHRAEYDFIKESKQRNNYRVNVHGSLTSYNQQLRVLNIPKFVRFILPGLVPMNEAEDEDSRLNPQLYKGFFENNQNIEEVYIPSSLSTVPARAFRSCKNIRRVVLAEGVTKIDRYAFFDCDKLEEIVLPSSLKEINHHAFCGCERLEQIILPSALESIGDRAFANCISLKSIVIPSNVTWISGGTFAYCTNLRSVHIKEGEHRLDISDAFDGCSALKKVTIENRPMDGIVGSSLVDGTYPLEEIEIAPEMEKQGYQVISNHGNVRLIKCLVTDGSLISYIDNCADTFRIPDGIKRITQDAFAQFNKREKVKVLEIGEEVEVIEPGAFSRFRNLKEIRVASNNRYYKAHNGILYNKSMTTLIKYPEKKEGETFIIPPSVTHLVSDALSMPDFPGATGMRYIFIPDTVTQIDENAVSKWNFLNVRYPAWFQA